MNQPFGPQDPNATRLGTFCLIIGFCLGLGLGVAAVASLDDADSIVPAPRA